MRISTGYQYDSYSRGIQDAQRKLVESQGRAISGKRINKPSDDPSGSASVVRLNALKSGLAQYRENGVLAKGILATTETTLSDVNDVAKKAYELTVRGSNSALDDSGRAALANEMSDLQKRLLELGNTKDPQGGYLFAGQKIDQAAFAVEGSSLVYKGDGRARLAEVAADQSLPVNVSGEPLLTDLYARIETSKQSLKVNDPTTLSSTSVPELQKSIDAINLQRGLVGTRLNTVSDLQTQHQRREDELTTRISDTEEVDMTQAITDYRLADSAYQAALNVASQGFRLSLMDFIRG